jgi:hypothetical protein
LNNLNCRKLLTLDPTKKFKDVDVLNFSFTKININEELTIQSNQEMIVSRELQNFGTLKIFGQLRVLADIELPVIPPQPLPDPENFSYRTIPNGQTVEITENQEMIVSSEIRVFGILKNLGYLRILDHGEEYNDFTEIELPFFEILVDEKVRIKPRQEYRVERLKLFGTLLNEGNLVIGV